VFLAPVNLIRSRPATPYQTRSLVGRASVQAVHAKGRLRLLSLKDRWRRVALTLGVHWDAFLLSPFNYLQGVWWRTVGLKLRSRNRFAALLGRSPRAYDLWIDSVEPGAQAELVGGRNSSDSILVVVLNPTDDRSARDTVRWISSSFGILPAIIGGSPVEGALQLASIRQLRSLVAQEGTWICFLEPGDRLAVSALEIYANAIKQQPGLTVIYSDDDLVTSGRRHGPHFKSSWNPELFEYHDFITGSSVVRVTLEMLEDLRTDGDQGDLVRAALSCGPPPFHVPLVLHHRARRPVARVPLKPVGASKAEKPSVTVIVPTRNRLSLLRTCIEGVERTLYPDIELIVVNNDSDDPATLRYLERLARDGISVLDVGGPFNFSALNNIAAASARGEVLCFLNNDVEIIDPDWLSALVPHAIRKDIGAVGACLLYPDGSVQHAGVVIGVGGGAAHAHRYLGSDDPGYFMRHRLPQRVSAVTAACMVVNREKFLAVGGFDEQEFPVAFNDVDLCLKLNARGWQSFYEPRAMLIHHESKSRGKDSARENRARFAGELAALKRRWGTDRIRDPYHHPHLSPFCEQFQIAL